LSFDYNGFLDALEAERDEINSLIAMVRKRAGMAPFGGPAKFGEPVPLPAPAITPSESAPYPRREPGPRPKEIICEVHPDNTERAGNGQCKICAREYARKRYQARKGKAAPPAEIDRTLKRGRPSKPCEKHPGAGRYASNRGCKGCVGEARQRSRERAKSEGAVTTHDRPESPLIQDPPESAAPIRSETAPTRKPETLPSDEEREWLYSKPVKCTKCGASITRFKRVAGAGYWICMANRCAVKVDSVHMPVDSKFQGVA